MKIEAKFKSVLVYEFTEYNGCRGHVVFSKYRYSIVNRYARARAMGINE
jgi:hypothetical protein